MVTKKSRLDVLALPWFYDDETKEICDREGKFICALGGLKGRAREPMGKRERLAVATRIINDVCDFAYTEPALPGMVFGAFVELPQFHHTDRIPAWKWKDAPGV